MMIDMQSATVTTTVSDDCTATVTIATTSGEMFALTGSVDSLLDSLATATATMRFSAMNVANAKARVWRIVAAEFAELMATELDLTGDEIAMDRVLRIEIGSDQWDDGWFADDTVTVAFRTAEQVEDAVEITVRDLSRDVDFEVFDEVDRVNSWDMTITRADIDLQRKGE